MSVQAEYVNEPMKRSRAVDLQIAFGLTFDLPVRRLANGEGYDAVVPMEFLAMIDEVKELLDRLDR